MEKLLRMLAVFALCAGFCGALLAAFCPQCGKKVKDDAKFCEFCGQKQGASPTKSKWPDKNAAAALPKTPVFQSIDEANTYFELAEQERNAVGAAILPHLKKKRYKKALELYLDIIKKWPNSDKCEQSAYNAAMIYESVAYEDYNQAIQYYRRVLEINPETILDCRLQVARVTEEKIEDYERAVILYEDTIANARVQDEKESAAKHLKKLREKMEKAREKLDAR